METAVADSDPKPVTTKQDGGQEQQNPLNKTKIRSRLPLDLRCTAAFMEGGCGERMNRGKRFIGTKEDIPGEKHLGIMAYRLYLNCTRCNSVITFKTDPRNSCLRADGTEARGFYVCEHGAVPHDEAEVAAEKAKRRRCPTTSSTGAKRACKIRTF